MNVRDITGTFEGVPYDDDGLFADTAPCMMVRTPEGGYDTYYYLSDGVWSDELGGYGPGWCDAGGSELGEDAGVIPVGTAVWFVDQNNTKSSVTIAGEVLSDATTTISFNTGYTLSAVPYPKSVSFNDIKFVGIEGVPYDDDGLFADTAPCMMVRTPEGGYDTYYYLSDGVWSDELGGYGPGWCDAGGSELASYDEIAIQFGSAFWIYLTGDLKSFSATFSL